MLVWPTEEGYYWLHRNQRNFPITLVRVARSGDGKLMVNSEAELFYKQQMTME
jgi:hypothetical protein